MLKGTGDFVVSQEAVVTVFIEQLPEQEATAAGFARSSSKTELPRKPTMANPLQMDKASAAPYFEPALTLQVLLMDGGSPVNTSVGRS